MSNLEQVKIAQNELIERSKQLDSPETTEGKEMNELKSLFSTAYKGLGDIITESLAEDDRNEIISHIEENLTIFEITENLDALKNDIIPTSPSLTIAHGEVRKSTELLFEKLLATSTLDRNDNLPSNIIELGEKIEVIKTQLSTATEEETTADTIAEEENQRLLGRIGTRALGVGSTIAGGVSGFFSKVTTDPLGGFTSLFKSTEGVQDDIAELGKDTQQLPFMRSIGNFLYGDDSPLKTITSIPIIGKQFGSLIASLTNILPQKLLRGGPEEREAAEGNRAKENFKKLFESLGSRQPIRDEKGKLTGYSDEKIGLTIAGKVINSPDQIASGTSFSAATRNLLRQQKNTIKELSSINIATWLTDNFAVDNEKNPQTYLGKIISSLARAAPPFSVFNNKNELSLSKLGEIFTLGDAFGSQMYPDLSQEELNNIDIDEEALLNAAETLIPTLRVRDTPALTAPANTPEPVATTEEPTTSTNQIDSSTTPESTNTEESTASQLPAVTGGGSAGNIS